MSLSQSGWKSALGSYADSRSVTLFFLGFSAGIPLLLIFSSLSLWLREAGVDRGTVTMFSWAALAYSFKFAWAPLVDSFQLPVLHRVFGKRRSWLLSAQILIIAAICLMAAVDPSHPGALTAMAGAAALLGFSSATQDVVIDAYRIEIAREDHAMQSVTAAMYNAGYRIGMIAAGAGALYLASWLGSKEGAYLYEAWRNTYFAMALTMGIGVMTTLLCKEPATSSEYQTLNNTWENLRLVLLFAFMAVGFIAGFSLSGHVLPKYEDALAAFMIEAARLGAGLVGALLACALVLAVKLVPASLAKKTWLDPFLDFFRRYGRSALLLLALIGLYRISDIVAGVISNVFYQDMGFSKEEIATAVKTFGLIMVIAGGLLGGILAQRFALMKLMMLGALLSSATNLLFVLLAGRGHDVWLMYLAVCADNLAVGLAGAVFVAFLSALTNIRFTAMQYALFSSLMTLLPKLLGGYSGMIVDNIGYQNFFLFTAGLGLPVLFLVYWVDKKVFRQQG